VGGFVNVLFTNTPHIIVKWVTIRAARWPDLLQPELQEVFLAPILGGLTIVGRRPILLEHVVAPVATLSIQGFTTTGLSDILSVDLQPLDEDVRQRHHVALIADQAKHHGNGRELSGHHNRNLTNVGSKLPVILPVLFLVL
jgi:hypothetical protein